MAGAGGRAGGAGATTAAGRGLATTLRVTGLTSGIGFGPPRISEASFTSVGSTPAQTAAMIKAESEKFRPIIAEAGIKIDQ